MYKNRHFIILLSCLVCMGVLLWSYNSALQAGESDQGWFAGLGDWGEAVTAIAQGEPLDGGAGPEAAVRGFWQQLDLRQLDLAKSALTQDMLERADVQEMFVLFADNPLISIQSCTVTATDIAQRYLVKMKWNSVISEKEERVYFCDIQKTEGKWMITHWIKA